MMLRRSSSPLSAAEKRKRRRERKRKNAADCRRRKKAGIVIAPVKVTAEMLDTLARLHHIREFEDDAHKIAAAIARLIDGVRIA